MSSHMDLSQLTATKLLQNLNNSPENEKDGGEETETNEEKQEHLQVFFMILLTLLMIYTVLGLYIEKKKPIVGHETGVVIVIGMIISFIFLAYEGKEKAELLKFDGIIFFELLLPLIIFASGYNLKRKKFFENFTNITKFGLFGTIITFIFYASMTKMMLEMFEFKKYFPIDAIDKDNKKTAAGELEPISFTGVEILFIASIFTSSDIIAAITIVKFEDFPKLFSIILGEGLANDAVAIILFDTMKDFEFEGTEFTFTTPFSVLGKFLVLLVMSTAIGLFFGLGASLMTKNFRIIS